MKAVILHGKGSNHTDNWYSWTAGKLEKRGWQVWVPDLPDWDKPDAKKGTEFLLGQGWDWSDTVVIGHSAGSVEILPLLEALPEGTKVRAAVLVATFTKELSEDDDWVELKGLFTRPFDFQKIRTKADKFLVIHSDDDPICPVAQAKEVCRNLNGEFISLPNHQHFSVSRSGSRFEKFPELIGIIEQKVLK